MNVIFLPTIFVPLYVSPPTSPLFFSYVFTFVVENQSYVFAITKKLQECVSSEWTLCMSDMGWREGASSPEKLHNIFSDRGEKKVDIQSKGAGGEGRRGRRSKKGRGQCGLCLELMFSGERSNQ